ncbi:hypothetical protein CRYUN_Cryun39dG0080200 [Craigia yunnanensis]
MESSASGINVDDYNTELLPHQAETSSSSWRLTLDKFRLPQQRLNSDDHRHVAPFSLLLCTPKKQRKVSEYYKKQERLLEGFNEMETVNEMGCLPGSLTEGIIVFASVMATLGLQILLESVRELIAKDHFFDVITNSVGLATAVLAIHFQWWIDPTGAIIIALYTMSTWARTVIENVWSLIGRTAPPDFLAKLTYLIWNHHKEIEQIDTVRAYTFGSHYFVEVDIVLPEDMLLSKAHNIGEKLQEKLEQLPEVERAFVHINFEFTHRPEHKTMV